jgi:hypothetical protein
LAIATAAERDQVARAAFDAGPPHAIVCRTHQGGLVLAPHDLARDEVGAADEVGDEGMAGAVEIGRRASGDAALFITTILSGTPAPPPDRG